MSFLHLPSIQYNRDIRISFNNLCIPYKSSLTYAVDSTAVDSSANAVDAVDTNEVDTNEVDAPAPTVAGKTHRMPFCLKPRLFI